MRKWCCFEDSVRVRSGLISYGSPYSPPYLVFDPEVEEVPMMIDATDVCFKLARRILATNKGNSKCDGGIVLVQSLRDSD